MSSFHKSSGGFELRLSSSCTKRFSRRPILPAHILTSLHQGRCLSKWHIHHLENLSYTTQHLPLTTSKCDKKHTHCTGEGMKTAVSLYQQNGSLPNPLRDCAFSHGGFIPHSGHPCMQHLPRPSQGINGSEASPCISDPSHPSSPSVVTAKWRKLQGGWQFCP